MIRPIVGVAVLINDGSRETVRRVRPWGGADHPTRRCVVDAGHPPLLGWLLDPWQELFCLMKFAPRPFGLVQEFPLNIAAASGLAFLSFHVIDRPFIRLGHRLATPTSPGRADIRV